ncbi:AAA family ATPase [bacterium]|nr:AAA family ATPase [bacterium]
MKAGKYLARIGDLICLQEDKTDLESLIDNFIHLDAIKPFNLNSFDVKFLACMWNEIIENQSRNTDIFSILSKFITSRTEQLDSFDNIITLLKKDILYSSIKELIIMNNWLVDADIYINYKKSQLINCEIEFHRDFMQVIFGEKKGYQEDNNIPYENNQEYLNDWFSYLEYLNNFIKEKSCSTGKTKILYSNKAQAYLKVLNWRIKIGNRLKLSNQTFPFNNLSEEFNLDEKEKIILMYLVKAKLDGETSSTDEVVELISIDQNEIFANKPYLDPKGHLAKNKLIEYIESSSFISQVMDIVISTDIMNRIIKKEPLTDEEKIKQIIESNNIFTLIKPTQTFEQLILPLDIKNTIKTSLKLYDKSVSSTMLSWGILRENSKVVGDDKTFKHSLLMLFYGHPGTGKTFTAGVIANYLGKDLLVTDISKLKSKWVGESEKNIKRLFATYEKIVRKVENPPVLLLNEADQFLTKRNRKSENSVDNMLNSMQNLFLESFENLDGFLIATTNLVDNLDEAFSRRFHLKLELPFPTANERLELWKSKLPNIIPGYEDLDLIYLANNYSITGGQIDVIIKNACTQAAAKEVVLLTQADLEKYCTLEKNSAFDKSTRKIIGF